MSARAEVGQCPICGKDRELLTPLHGEKGGPLTCIRCGMDWHGNHGRRRNAGRIVIKAIKAYYAAGGHYEDIAKLNLATSDIGFSMSSIALGYKADTIGTELPDLTTELLTDVLQLVHPDHQPPERHELAKRVTQELLALKPFVFLAPKREPSPKPEPRDEFLKVQRETSKEPSQKEWTYPCEDCADHVPFYYCTLCKAQYEKERREKHDRHNAKQREWYERRKSRQRSRPETCAICGKSFEKRADANCCSAACRQKLYRQRKSGTCDKKPSQKQVARRQVRERKASITLKWKKLSSLPHGSFVVVNADRDSRFPKGTKLKKDGWLGWGFWLEDSNGNNHIFNRRALERYDIVPDGIKTP